MIELEPHFYSLAIELAFRVLTYHAGELGSDPSLGGWIFKNPLKVGHARDVMHLRSPHR